MVNNSEKALILFDGVCNLCNSTVQFIIKRDKKNLFQFAALQSEIGQKKLANYNLHQKKIDSIVLIINGKAYIYSAAALRIFWNLGNFWILIKIFWLIPFFIRDWIYKLIAYFRYRFFGKKTECMLPNPEWKNKFL